MHDASARVLRSLPRPEPPPSIDAAPIPLPKAWPRPTVGEVIRRGLRWARAGAGFAGRVLADRARGRASMTAVGEHLREAFEEVGGTAIKIGQQLSVRLDLLPFEFCMALAELTDKVRPFSTERAIAEIEAATGGPVERTFASLDPEPIGSASIACVYKGVLRTGEEVAIKVQRPDVERQFVTDIFMVSLFTRLAERLGAVPDGFFKHMLGELRTMFLEEIDFTIEARYQSLFRQYVERDKIDWLTCPRLWHRWCTDKVLVTEFIDGVPCAEVLAAVETQQPEALRALEAMNIEPALVGKRIFQMSYWGRFEVPFVHGDPHPANVIILEDSRVCMLDFGACTVIPRKTRVYHLQLLHHMVNDRVSEATEVFVADTAPLPNIDLTALRRDMAAKVYEFQATFRDPESEWFERTGASLWVKVLDVAQAYQLPVNVDTLRMIRLLLLSDTLAFRLSGEISVKETRRYFRAAEKRLVRRLRKRQRTHRRGGPAPILLLDRLRDARRNLQQIEDRLEARQHNALSSFNRLLGWGATVGRWALGWAVGLGVLYGVPLVMQHYDVQVLPRVQGWILGWLDAGGALVLLVLLSLSAQRLRYRLRDVRV